LARLRLFYTKMWLLGAPNRVKALHMLTGLQFGTRYSSTLWSAGVSYPGASVEL
jgi:hypothetical protein